MTVAEIRALIAQLQQQIAQLQQQLTKITGEEEVWCHDFHLNLKYGMGGTEVKALQTALEKEGFYKRTITSDFDEYTASCVVGFQEKYKKDVLAPWGLEHGTGYVGPTTRAKLNKLCGCVVVKPYIKVLSPNGGEKWVVGNTYNITWESSGIDKVNIYLEEIELPGGIWQTTECLQESCDPNVSFCPPCDKLIASNISASLGKYSWTIPANQQVLTKAKIAIYSVSAGKISDKSDNYFSIVSAITPSLTVIYPNGGEIWKVGSTYDITWRSSGIDKVDVSLCGQIPIDIAGNCLPVIAEDISANLGKYSWTIPSDISPKDGYRIRIFDGKTNLQDDTDNYFSIVAKADDPVQCSITTSKTSVSVDESFDITVKAQDDDGVARIYYLEPNGRWTVLKSCGGATDCSGTISRSENSAGTYTYYGGAYGYLPDGKNELFARCGPVKVTVTEAKSITVISPNGGEKWVVGNSYDITWQAIGIDTISITLIDYRAGPVETTIASNISAVLGKYSWTIPTNTTPGTSAFKIAIRGKAIEDLSDNYFSIVAPTPSITVISPNGGEKWVVGKTYEITWRSSGIDKVDVSLCGQIPIDIAGNCLPVIAEDISANLGKYSWTIPSDISPKDGYRIRIFDGKTNLQDDTDNYFSIVAPAPSITVLSPNGGEKWVRGNTYKITWSMEGIESVNVEYIKKGPEEFDVYYVISSNLYKGEAFYWDIPLDFPTGEYKIVVVEVVPSGGYATIDYSDNYFSIVEGGLGLKYIEIQLASLSEAVLQLAEKIKLLMRR